MAQQNSLCSLACRELSKQPAGKNSKFWPVAPFVMFVVASTLCYYYYHISRKIMWYHYTNSLCMCAMRARPKLENVFIEICVFTAPHVTPVLEMFCFSTRRSAARGPTTTLSGLFHATPSSGELRWCECNTSFAKVGRFSLAHGLSAEFGRSRLANILRNESITRFMPCT